MKANRITGDERVMRLVTELLESIRMDDQYGAQESLDGLWNIPDDEREDGFPLVQVAGSMV